jgi:IS30 family transposase
MKYRQLTAGERYALSALRRQGLSNAAIARAMGRHPSTIGRELKRNAIGPRKWYVPSKAGKKARGRRSRARRNLRIRPDHWQLVVSLLEEFWSPEQISGTLRMEGRLRISHETIYRHVWADRARGGSLFRFLRQASKQRRKRHGSNQSRGRVAGKRSITERPPGAENRSRVGHLEGDTVMGSGDKHCILTLVDRKTGYVMIGKLAARTVEATNQRAISLLRNAPRSTRTLTFDNGTEFHGYKTIETSSGATVYFATPHHSWERGTSENTNGLIRQYLPKRTSMAHLTQTDCTWIADHLNSRPRKRLGFLTPAQCYEKKIST